MKNTMLICAPLSSRSGYGNHGRDLFYSFDKMEKFEIKESPFKKKETKPTFKLLKGMSINGKPLSETLKEVINE